MKVLLDCAKLLQRTQAHLYLQERLGFPPYYGKNLDALYDCLTELADCTIVLNGEELLLQDKGYGAKILRVLKEAAQANPGLRLEPQAPEERMRLLFEIDTKDYDPDGPVFVRPSVRGIIIRQGQVAMVHSLKYDYYKFPGGGLEPGETQVEALSREVREESGLVVLPDTIRPFGYVHRVQKGANEARFIQDNFYYLCDAAPEPLRQELDGYEAEERFTLEFVKPLPAIRTNREKDHGPKDPNMLEREAKVLERLMEEGFLPDEG